MKTVTIASAKGGSGKSTVASLLAVRAAQDNPKVAMIDLDSQGSLTQWWTIRGEPKSPKLVQIEEESIPSLIKKLASSFDWLIVDTPPFEMELIEQAIAIADAVVIPVKAGLFDVMAAQPVAEMCEERHRPFSLLLNAIDSRFKNLEREAKGAIVDIGPLFASHIEHRRGYIEALSVGKTGAEVDKAAKKEVDGLWVEVKRLAEKGRG